MKVFVFYENTGEQAAATNLVAVLKKIGQLLCYSKVGVGGVTIENWQNQPPIKMECTAMSAIPKAGSIAVSSSGAFGYSGEFEYRDGAGYYGVMGPSPSIRVLSRDEARDLVRPFPPETYEAILGKKKPKPKVPPQKPNTTKTGVTIRAIDIDDDHEEEH